MSHTLMHPKQHHHHTFLWYLMIGLGIMAVFIVIVAILPYIMISSPTAYTVRGDHSGYVEYLRGEKVIYASRLELNNALTDYHVGEKITGATLLDSYSAITKYHMGEKPIVNLEMWEAALLAYRQGEKDYK